MAGTVRGRRLAVSSKATHIDAAILTVPVNAPSSRALWVRLAVLVGAASFLIAALLQIAGSPEGWAGQRGLELVLLALAAMLTRRFGFPLPGRGFASFVLGVALLGLLLDGWPFSVLTTTAGMLAGDLLFRRLKPGDAVSNVAHLGFGTGLTGLAYQALGGAVGDAVLRADNLGPLTVGVVLLTLIVNGTFYLELSQGPRAAWVDARLTVRWELAVYAASAAEALGWVVLVAARPPAVVAIYASLLLVAALIGVYGLIRAAVRADQLHLVQRIAGELAGDLNIERSFERVQDAARHLVPWEGTGLARCDGAAGDLTVVADSGLGSARWTVQDPLTAEVMRSRRPLVEAGHAGAGSEILIPLRHGTAIVGLWSVRHSRAGMYREADAELLDLLAPQLAVSLVLGTLARPLGEAASQSVTYVRQLTDTTDTVRQGFTDVAQQAARAEQDARRARGEVEGAVQTLTQLVEGLRQTGEAAATTRETSAAVQRTVVDVRTASGRTVEQLRQLAATIEQGAAEVGRLREAATEVERFSETISGIAYQTNLLALNATIEAARAGTSGRGFGVVADEVRKLAEESERAARNIGKSARDTRKVVERASQLLDGIGGQLTDLMGASARWGAELETIVSASDATRAAVERMARLPADNLVAAEAANQLLARARAAAGASADEAAAVAAAAAEQLRVVSDLTRGAADLSRLAERLAEGARLMEGDATP